jgi:hypothetical protein
LGGSVGILASGTLEPWMFSFWLEFIALAILAGKTKGYKANLHFLKKSWTY